MIAKRKIDRGEMVITLLAVPFAVFIVAFIFAALAWGSK
jgi:hypothetical protein